MRILKDTIRRNVIIRPSDERVESAEFVDDLKDSIRATDAYTLEIDGLSSNDIKELHDALVCCDLPNTLSKLVYQNLSNAAEREFKNAFRLWNVELLRKENASVNTIRDFHTPGMVIRGYDLISNSLFAEKQAKYLSADEITLSNADTDREAASTAFNLYYQTGGLKK